MQESRATTPRATRPDARGVYRLFRIFGFEVKLNLTWLLLAFLITWTLGAGLFPAEYPGLPPATYWWMGLAGAVGILFSIVFHELTHSLVARRYGLPIRGITLFIFGGVAEMEEEPSQPKVEFLMAVAGPIASLVLAGVFRVIEGVATLWGGPVPAIAVVHYLGLVNLVLALFNLVPAFPLDGGRMLRAALWQRTGDLRKATSIASRIGSGFGIALMVLGGLAFIQGSFVTGMWWFLIGAFLRSAATGSYRQLLIRDLLGDKPVGDLMSPDPVTVDPATTIERLLEDYVYRHHYKLLPVTEGGRLVGCITLQDVKTVPREARATTTVGEIASPCAPRNSVAPELSASVLAAEMGKPGAATRRMVVKDGRLLGVISLRDLSEYVALKLDLDAPGGR